MDSQPPNRYAKSTRPVNSRTARPLPEPVATVHPLVEQRIAAQRAKNRLGAPLADLLVRQQRLQRSPGTPFLAAGSATLTAVTGSGLLLAALQQSWWIAAAASVGVLAGLTGIGLALARRRQLALTAGSAPATAALPLWDEASIAALDNAIAALAPVLPTAAGRELSAIKLQLARVQQQTMGLAAGGDENFTMDDRLYLGEFVRRYLPDTLQSYLAVPEGQREVAVNLENATATTLLLSQLQMLRLELDKKETKLALSRTENLQRQQRFLQSKASR